MRSYTKPEMVVERFNALQAVASNCSSQWAGDQTVYEAQDITCVVTKTTDNIFTDSTCGSVVDPASSGEGWCFVTYNGNLYFLWRDTNKGTGGNVNDILPILNAAKSAGNNITYNNYGMQTVGSGRNQTTYYWHGGIATGSVVSFYNHS